MPLSEAKLRSNNQALSNNPWLDYASSLQETGIGSKCTTTCYKNKETKVDHCETKCDPIITEKINQVNDRNGDSNAGE